MQPCLSNYTIPRAVHLKTIVLYCRRNARLLVHTSPPRKCSECATHFLIHPACNSPYMQYYFKRFSVSKVIVSFLIKKSRQNAIEIETAFFSFSWESQGSHIGSFLLCFTYPSQLSLRTDTYIDELVEIFLKLSIKTVQVHLIIWTTLV